MTIEQLLAGMFGLRRCVAARARPAATLVAPFALLPTPGPAARGGAARRLRGRDKQLWRRTENHVSQARRRQGMSGASSVGNDDTSRRRGQHHVTVVHDLHA